MPRIKRTLFDNAVYHIFNRGHNKQDLFLSPTDFMMFKDILSTYKRKVHFELYHYCLMSNHFHLLLMIVKGQELPFLMKGICQSYANYYKKQYNLVGYLFQNRYKSIVIEKDEYLLECGRYIERNPVRAGIIEAPAEYGWSSYNFYANDRRDDLITPDPLYLSLSPLKKERRQMYAEYVSVSRPYEELVDEKILELK